MRMGSSSKKKKSVGASKPNGSLKQKVESGTFRLDTCLNCETPLDNGTTKVAEFMLSFSETSKRTFSVLEALTSIFEISNTHSNFFPLLTSKNLVMCPPCATVLANLYKSYVELMQLSKKTANICKLVSKAEKWHTDKNELLPEEEEEEEEEVEENEEEEDSDSDPGVRKRKKEESESDYDDATYNGNSRKGKRSTWPTKNSGAKAKKRRKTTIVKQEAYEDESDEDYGGGGGKSKKTGSGVDRGRLKKRLSLALDGSPRKRIRRRPSQAREDDYKCTECERIFKFECRLIKHMKSHVDERKQQCHLCHKSFLYSWMLENHILGEHEHMKPKKCDTCEMLFYRNDIYETHFCTPVDMQEAERREKPNQCQLCGKAFQKLAHLTLHLRSHEEEKPLSCTHCSLKFKYEKCLQKHLVVHQSSLSCPYCPKLFSQKSKLGAHVAAHEQESGGGDSSTTPLRPSHPCPNAGCGKKFKLPTALARHLTKCIAEEEEEEEEGGGGGGEEEGEEEEAQTSNKHFCENCEKGFERKSDLSRHMRNKVCTRRVKKEVKEEGDGESEAEENSGPHSGGEEAEGESDLEAPNSMSPAVSASENEVSVSMPSSPSSPPPKLNLSEDDSNSLPPSSPPPHAPNLGEDGLKGEVEDSFLSDKDSN